MEFHLDTHPYPLREGRDRQRQREMETETDLNIRLDFNAVLGRIHMKKMLLCEWMGRRSFKTIYLIKELG